MTITAPSPAHAGRAPARESASAVELPELIRNVTALASLPGACHRVMQIADDQRASARDMAEIISLDPGLAARLLRLVNSVYYGLPRQVDNVAQAVQIVGTNALRNLALATGALSAFKGIPSNLVDMDAFWNASVHCGLLARALARIARHQQVERLFATGLLHAVGQLVMYHQAPERSRLVLDQIQPAPQTRPEIEQQVFGYTYCEVGAALLEAWQLPPSMWLPIRYHRRPALAPDFRTDAALLAIAQAVTAAVEPDVKRDATPQRADPVIEPIAWLQSGLVADVLPNAIDEVDAQWFEVIEIVAPGGTLVY
jgi:HD-like signal output (HDOD) protein